SAWGEVDRGVERPWRRSRSHLSGKGADYPPGAAKLGPDRGMGRRARGTAGRTARGTDYPAPPAAGGRGQAGRRIDRAGVGDLLPDGEWIDQTTGCGSPERAAWARVGGCAAANRRDSPPLPTLPSFPFS